MRRPLGRWTDEQVEQIVGNLLRGGVILAAGVVAIGGVLYLIHYGMASPNYHIFREERSSLRQLPGIVADAASLRRRGLIQLGLVLLIATPIVRVAFSAFAFAKQHDYTYVVITLIVLVVLMYSLLGA
ncbi:MAG: DUF1634 domain-containing protein [Chroococcidiopsidaceae cyanobacterium CP_BM_RX_35]|nr:DUF1634 domain-containing protein [Chroococcidiopsidaceae cyanobacterium CP_BM_RX_35]